MVTSASPSMLTQFAVSSMSMGRLGSSFIREVGISAIGSVSSFGFSACAGLSLNRVCTLNRETYYLNSGFPTLCPTARAALQGIAIHPPSLGNRNLTLRAAYLEMRWPCESPTLDWGPTGPVSFPAMTVTRQSRGKSVPLP